MFFEPEPCREREAGKVPRRLEYIYSGPHKVFDVCDDPTHRIIIHQGRKKLIKVNINRLRSWEPFSKQHLFTDPPQQREDGKEEPDVAMDWHQWKVTGELVAVPLAAGDVLPFGIGKILRRRSPNTEHGDLLIQWLSNEQESLTRSLNPGWIQLDKKVGLKKGRKAQPQHQPGDPNNKCY